MKATTTCSTCLNFADTGAGLECLNLVSFRQPGHTLARSAQPTDTCPDHRPNKVNLMAHPDGDFSIDLKLGDHGTLIVTDIDGSTVKLKLSALGLIELGLDIARHGKQML